MLTHTHMSGWTATAILSLAACGLDADGTADPAVGDAATSSASAGASTSTGSAGGGAAGSGGGSGVGGATGTAAGGTGGAGNGGAGGGPLSCNGPEEFFGGPEMHCYQHKMTNSVDFMDARAACSAWGGELAGVSSEAEYDFILGEAPNDDYWIGAFNAANDGQPSGFDWVNGEPWGVSGWGASSSTYPWKNGEPVADKPCGKMKDGFESRPCAHTPPQGYICERP